MPDIVPPASASPGREIGDFQILKQLQQGSTGTIYLAHQVSRDRTVALKIFPENLVENAESMKRFHCEAQTAARLSHENLVLLYAVGEEEGHLYAAMEYVDGEELGTRLKQVTAMPPHEALHICLDVAHGLQHGWQEAHLTHRDIRPSNIFLSEDGVVKLRKLGFPKWADSFRTGLLRNELPLATAHYLSPEQARGDCTLDLRSDIYSLGCTLYEMLTGKAPYRGSEHLTIIGQHLDAPFPAILQEWPQCPLSLARMIDRMLKKRREDRFQTYEELIGAIAEIWAGIEPWSIRSENATPPPRVKRQAFGPFAVGLLVVAILVFSTIAGDQDTPPPVSFQATANRIRIRMENHGNAPTSYPDDLTDEPFWRNGLGMKFVPVSIIGGPTDGQTIFFSIWETRVQDYAIFARETQRNWPSPGFAQEPTHPAVNISWEDATAFCEWLTTHEREAGRLKGNEVYRLPSDHEWSCAAGIGKLENATKRPKEKDQKIANHFPWGEGWPPPEGAGNYAGEELKTESAKIKYAWINDVIPGFNDGLIETAPVENSLPNNLGIFDLGGNAWEWCNDFYDEISDHHVLRGASWLNGGPSHLLTSRRVHLVGTARDNVIGVRCVLDISAEKTDAH